MRFLTIAYISQTANTPQIFNPSKMRESVSFLRHVYTLRTFKPSKMRASISFLRQFTQCERSSPRKCVRLFHFSDSLHTVKVRALKNACVCFISQTVYTLRTFEPSKMRVSVSFLRQFTHCKFSPLKNACMCFACSAIVT